MNHEAIMAIGRTASFMYACKYRAAQTCLLQHCEYLPEGPFKHGKMPRYMLVRGGKIYGTLGSGIPDVNKKTRSLLPSSYDLVLTDAAWKPLGIRTHEEAISEQDQAGRFVIPMEVCDQRWQIVDEKALPRYGK